MGEERDVSHHLMIGPLILLCTLDHFIQHQHTIVHLANRREQGERHDREKGEEGKRARGRGFCTLDNCILHQHTV